MFPSAQSGDVEVLQAAVAWLEKGEQVLLFTVVDTWGSAPRRPGCMMALHPDGEFAGSVSGGCLEDELVQQQLRGGFSSGLPRLLDFGISRASAGKVGLPCGGSLTLLVEQLDSPAQLKQILATIVEHEKIVRRVCLETGETSLHPIASQSDRTELEKSGNNIYKQFGPAWRLLLIGAGDLSRRVALQGRALDYAITICDPRPEYAHGWSVPECDLTIEKPFLAVQKFKPDANTCVLALSHSAALDDKAIQAALEFDDCFYTGVLGSRKSSQECRERLQQAGVSNERIGRLHAPVGMDIGSHTPAEIAIAIMAELISLRNARTAHSKQNNDSCSTGTTVSGTLHHG